jgi:hypothetical protein
VDGGREARRRLEVLSHPPAVPAQARRREDRLPVRAQPGGDRDTERVVLAP